MALKADKSLFGRLGHERGVEVGTARHEGHVHTRAAALLDRRPEEVGLIEVVIEQCSLLLVASPHARKTTLTRNPLEHLTADVDTPAVRRIVEGAGIGLRLEAQHRGNTRQIVGDEVVAHDHDLHACGTDVLLDPRVYQSKVGDVNGLREKH